MGFIEIVLVWILSISNPTANQRSGGCVPSTGSTCAAKVVAAPAPEVSRISNGF